MRLLKRPHLWLLAVFAAQFVSAQSLSVGIKGGVALTDEYTAELPVILRDESRGYTVGPMVELQLPKGFAIEFDALYRRLGRTADIRSSSSQTISGQGAVVAIQASSRVFLRERLNSWEFPVLAKYRFSDGRMRPFAGAGIVTRVFHGSRQGFALFRVLDVETAFRLDGDAGYGPQVGAVVSGGIEFRVGSVRIAPELRYTRWKGQYLDAADSVAIASEQNRAAMLLGISWR